MKIMICTLHISHRHGDNIIVCTSREEATAALGNYCEVWWSDVPDSPPMPADDTARIELYFSLVEDESANIEEHSLVVPIPTEELIREALNYEAAAFDNDTEVNGADLVDWFADWRTRMKTRFPG